MLSEQTASRNNSLRHASGRRILTMLLRFAMGAGLLAYLAKSGVIDLRALSKLFTSWRITLAAVTLLLVDSALMSVRLSWLFRPQGLNLRFGTSLKLALVGFFFRHFFAGSGWWRPVKAFLYDESKRRTPYRDYDGRVDQSRPRFLEAVVWGGEAFSPSLISGI